MACIYNSTMATSEQESQRTPRFWMGSVLRSVTISSSKVLVQSLNHEGTFRAFAIFAHLNHMDRED